MGTVLFTEDFINSVQKIEYELERMNNLKIVELKIKQMELTGCKLDYFELENLLEECK